MSYKYLTFLIIPVLIICGCREEIIEPDNIAGNINQPVKTNHQNYYSFAINAENISTNNIDYTVFTGNLSRFSFSLNHYVSGMAEVLIYNRFNKIIFAAIIDETNEGSSFSIENEQPFSIQIKLNDFSGKLKITLSAQ